MLRLEKMLEVPSRYYEISVSAERIVGLKVTFPQDHEEFYLDLLDKDGKLVKEFGRDYQLQRPSHLYRGLNPFEDGTGRVDPLKILGHYVTLPFQATYNFVTLPAQKRFVGGLRQSLDHLWEPTSIAATADRLFILDQQSSVLFGPRHYFENTDVSLAVFDKEGNPLKKTLKTGADPGDVNLSEVIPLICAFEDKLILADCGGRRMQEFDLEGNFVRVLADDIPGRIVCGYSDFAVGSSGAYLALISRGERDWNTVGRVTFDGELTMHNLGSDLGLVSGLAVSEDNVFIRSRNEILTYTSDMKLKERTPIEGIPEDGYSGDWHIEPNLEFHQGKLYLPALHFGEWIPTSDRVSYRGPSQPYIFQFSTE
ncbi:hypothetical protein HYT55_01610 [Candidatus Woesearchaeota archaeon]|nr:hypothetical protein [Candidatus Woesearchaeota archaeon]